MLEKYNRGIDSNPNVERINRDPNVEGILAYLFRLQHKASEIYKTAQIQERAPNLLETRFLPRRTEERMQTAYNSYGNLLTLLSNARDNGKYLSALVSGDELPSIFHEENTHSGMQARYIDPALKILKEPKHNFLSGGPTDVSSLDYVVALSSGILHSPALQVADGALITAIEINSRMNALPSYNNEIEVLSSQYLALQR